MLITIPSANRWNQVYNQTPLIHVPYHFANMANSAFMMTYLTTIHRLCPSGGRTLETGVGSGHGAIWLSLRGIRAEGLDYSPGIVERARAVNNLLGGSAQFRLGDLFELNCDDAQRFDVIHHQGVLEHFTVPQIHAALAQQVALANWVVFSVPSVYYPFDPEFGDERLMPIEEWARILAPFAVEELRYYGDVQNGENEHVLCVLRGEPTSKAHLPAKRRPLPETVGVESDMPGGTILVPSQPPRRGHSVQL